MKALLTAAVLVLSASAFAAGTTATTTTAGTGQTAQVAPSAQTVKVASNDKAAFKKECKAEGKKGKALKECIKAKKEAAKGGGEAPAAQ